MNKRDELTKTIQDLGMTALALFDEMQRVPETGSTRTASALRRLLSVYQRDLRVMLTDLKSESTEAAKRKKETAQ